MIMDRGREFCAEVTAMIKDECGVTKKLIATCNPQANTIVERVHKTVNQQIANTGLRNKTDVDA